MGKLGGRKTHTDFSNLLTELQSNYSTTHSESTATAEVLDPALEGADTTQSHKGQVIPFAGGFPDSDEEWQRIKSDESIKYAVRFGMIHAKCCHLIQDYPADSMRFWKSYPEDGMQCGECASRAYIRNGAEDVNNLDKYLAFFHRVNWKPKNIRRLYIEHDVRTRIDTDVITVWYAEDVWKIKSIPGTDRVELMHNNYVLRNGQRFFTNGFHTQIPYGDMNDAVNNIFGYDYRTHLMSATETNKKIDEESVSTSISEPETKAEQTLVPVEKPKRVKVPLRERWKYRIRLFMLRYLDLEYHIHIDGITAVKYAGKPNQGDICAILWKDEDDREHWMIASYAAKKNRFMAIFGEYQIRVPFSKVVAWKALDMSKYNPQPHESNPNILVIK